MNFWLFYRNQEQNICKFNRVVDVTVDVKLCVKTRMEKFADIFVSLPANFVNISHTW